MNCQRYHLQFPRLSFTVWGTGRTVFAVLFHDADFQKKIVRVEKYFDEISEGNHSDDIPNSFANYISLGRFQPQLEPAFLWGTEFQRQVWREVGRIPSKKTARYSEIAESIGNNKAYRAVGRAIGANPIPILVPCHRVFASNGLGGYSGGIAIKLELLEIEGVLPE